jgi:hypothetical protein
MSNLVPLSKSPLIKKQTSSIIKSANFSGGSKDIGSNVNNSKTKDKTLLEIYKKVIKIDNILKKLLKVKLKQTKVEKVSSEKKDFEKKEKELEKKKQPKEKSNINLPSTPKMGFLDWIKNFLLNTFLGFISIRLIDFLPQLMKILPTIIRAGEFLIDWGGKLLDGLVTFVDWGYKAIDGTRGFLKNLGGDGLVNNFDKFSGAIGNIIDVLILASIATMGMDSGDGGAGGRGGRRGFDSQGRRVGKDVQKRYAQRYGKDQFLDRFGKKNLKNLTGGARRGIFQKGARSAFMGLAGKGGAKTILKFVKPLVNKIPIIGGLLEFGLSWALGEPVGKAAFRAIGAVLVGAIGTAIGGPIGAFLGSWAGGEAGGLLYDMFFGNKKPKQGKVAKAAGGGKPSTRGGKLVGGPAKRTIKRKKTPRTLTVPPTKIKPGSAVGGEKKIKELYPESKDKTKMSPFDFIKSTYERLSRSKGLERVASLGLKPIMGDRLNYADFKGAATVINNWMNQTMTPETLAYAGGGEVRMEQVISGEDYSNVIAKSLQESVAPESEKIIQDLMKNLSLKPVGREEMIQENLKKDQIIDGEEFPGGGLTPGKWGPMLDLISSGEGNYDSVNPSLKKPEILSMNLNQLLEFKRVSKQRNGGSAALGRYQFINPQLAYQLAGLNPSEKFTPENQDKMAVAYLEKKRRGREWLEGKITTREYIEDLAREWGAFKSYSGFVLPGNSGKIGPEKIETALNKVKKGGYSQKEISDSSMDLLSPGGVSGYTVTRNGATIRRYSDLPPHHSGRTRTADGRVIQDFTLYKGNKFVNAPVISPVSGKITWAGPAGAGGNWVEIQSKDGKVEMGHFNKINVRSGQQVQAFRTVLGLQGYSGRVSPAGPDGTHIHMQAPESVLSGYVNRLSGSRFGGGLINKTGMYKLHKGEIVIDEDTNELFGKNFILDLNSIENKSQLIAKIPSIIEDLKKISNYTEDDIPTQIVYVEVPVPEIVPISSGSKSIIAAGGGSEDIDTMVFNAVG